MQVREAADKDALRAGTVYIAPPDYHLLVDPESVSLSTDEPVQFARPSIDVLFESAAESHRERCAGVVLTGANADGARGLRRIAELGGTTIVQDPEEAVRAEMPRAALLAVPEARVLPTAGIAPLLVDLCGLARVPA
jgi:two-component system chemotaxis response regulator CheB